MQRQRLTDGTVLVATCFVVLIVYSPTLIYPYLLADETWLVRPNAWGWTLPMGRPGFSVFAFLAQLIHSTLGFEAVIYAMRISAIVALGWSGWLMCLWFERWGHSRLVSWSIAVSMLTLPAFQIVVADGTQLAYSMLATVLSIRAFDRGFEARNWKSLLWSAFLLYGALTIYQQQALVFFALLAVPLLMHSRELSTYKYVVSSGVFVVAVSVIYFVSWRAMYRLVWPDRLDTRYGPDAVGLPGLEVLDAFVTNRLVQVANLWDVSHPDFGWITAVIAILVLVCAAMIIRQSTWRAPLAIGLLVGLLVATDAFRLVAGAYPSYVTATALSMCVFYLAVAPVACSRFGHYAAPLVLCLGAGFAFFTVKEVAYDNWRHDTIVREAMLANPEGRSLHIVGHSRSDDYQEFSWQNAGNDYYVSITASNIAEDLIRQGKLTEAPKVSVGEPIAIIDWAKIPHEPAPEAIVVVLD
ncbi:MAG: glucosyltransferase domain-containing protein [Gammaproteobacteria bacterium]|nr:glucosyltransferase domain-containing protein [Gammaproteobacteria bacterium]